MNLTPAAIYAYAKGDTENFIVASTPGGIENQEKSGQTSFCADSTLPIDCPRYELELMGIKFGEPQDDLFIKVTLPPGWKKQPSESSYWSYLLDDKDRKRAAIFYKAAFYDRKARMRLERRYSVNCYLDLDELHYQAAVMDADTIIHDLGPIKKEDYEANDRAELTGKKWLDEHFPDHKSVTAYWS